MLTDETPSSHQGCGGWSLASHYPRVIKISSRYEAIVPAPAVVTMLWLSRQQQQQQQQLLETDLVN